jgi:hypothetical protein
MADIDILRRNAFDRRIKNTEGLRIHWAPEQVAEIHDFIMSLPEKTFRTPARRLFPSH